MDGILNTPVTETLLSVYGYQKHPIYDYWFYPVNGRESAYRLEWGSYTKTWIAFLPCYRFPLVRELTTLKQLNNLHQGFYDKSLID